MFLEEIVKDINLENDTTEFKVKLNKEEPLSFLKTIAGFANASGGTLYIGVEDKTNKLIGFNKKEADSERNYLNNQINEHITPRPEIAFTFIKYANKDKELFVIKVSIKESIVKPVILKYNGMPLIYMRRSGYTNAATYEEIINMSINSKKVSYDLLISDQEYKKDDFITLFSYYKEHNNGKDLSEKALKSLGFMNNENKLTNGALLFKDKYKGDKTLIQCSLFNGFNKGSERIVTINRFNGNIIDSISYCMDFINSKMNYSIIKQDESRINIQSYPTRAIFEGVVNAIAHRDYFLDGTQIQIDMFKDRLEISSPGSFYNGEQIEKTYNLSSIISKRRNNIICGILVMCNCMEAAGTGFDKIVECYKEVDLKHKPYIYSKSDHFTLVLPDLTYVEGVVEDSDPKIISPAIENGSIHDEKILSYCYLTARNTNDIAKHLGISNSSYLKKNIIENLVNQNLLIKSVSSRSTYYKTNRELVELL